MSSFSTDPPPPRRTTDALRVVARYLVADSPFINAAVYTIRGNAAADLADDEDVLYVSPDRPYILLSTSQTQRSARSMPSQHWTVPALELPSSIVACWKCVTC